MYSSDGYARIFRLDRTKNKCTSYTAYYNQTGIIQEKVINKLCRHLKPDGYFFLGHSESITGINVPLRQVKPTTSSQRQLIQVNYGGLSKVKPARSLIKSLSKSGGRNHQGRLTAFRKGGGHKRRYRVIDFNRTKFSIYPNPTNENITISIANKGAKTNG